MADSRRWTAGTGVRRDDEFTRAPAFRDGLDSPPLSPQASWHGNGRTQVAFAVGLAIVAAAAAVAFMVLAPDSGADPGASGAIAQDDAPDGPIQLPGAAGNVTTGLPTPLPSPSVPAPLPLP